MNKGGNEPQARTNNETSFQDVYLRQAFYERNEQATILQPELLACIAGVQVTPAPPPLWQVGQVSGREQNVSADVREV